MTSINSLIDSHYIDRSIIGFVEPIVIVKNSKTKLLVDARIDSGATKCSIDEALVKKLKLGPFTGESTIKNANGTKRRKTLTITFIMSGKEITETFTVADRSKMEFQVLIERNALRKGFLIDPNKRTHRTASKDQTSLDKFKK